MKEILLIYSTTDGQTLKICRRLKNVLEVLDRRVRLVDLQEATALDLEDYAMIVIGASIRYGRHRRPLYEFVEKNRERLDAGPNAFFSVNVVARKLDKSTPETNPYLLRFLAQIAWRPKNLAVFGGKIDYASYRFWDRQMIRLIMWMTGGPTAADTVVEYTDWQQVENFGRQLSLLYPSQRIGSKRQGY